MLQIFEFKNYEAILISGLRKAFKAKQDKTMIGDLIDWCSGVYGLGREDQKAFLGFCIQFFPPTMAGTLACAGMYSFR